MLSQPLAFATNLDKRPTPKIMYWCSRMSTLINYIDSIFISKGLIVGFLLQIFIQLVDKKKSNSFSTKWIVHCTPILFFFIHTMAQNHFSFYISIIHIEWKQTHRGIFSFTVLIFWKKFHLNRTDSCIHMNVNILSLTHS